MQRFQSWMSLGKKYFCEIDVHQYNVMCILRAAKQLYMLWICLRGGLFRLKLKDFRTRRQVRRQTCTSINRLWNKANFRATPKRFQLLNAFCQKYATLNISPFNVLCKCVLKQGMLVKPYWCICSDGVPRLTGKKRYPELSHYNLIRRMRERRKMQ